MDDKLKDFINENIDLINQNTKESWEQVYDKISWGIRGEFTQMLFDAHINDPAKIMGYIPGSYLRNSDIKKYYISNNITSIGSSAFYNCDSLTEIIIGDSVMSIGYSAFADCDSLTSVIISNGVTSISREMFYNCKKLMNVEIGDNVTSIYIYAFSKCSSLTSITIPSSVTTVGDYAFLLCNNLKEINFKGTKQQAIKLGIGNKAKTKWREASSIEKIICTDGVIEL